MNRDEVPFTITMGLASKAKQEAIEKGEQYYFTGKPCSRGHLSKRRVSNHVCMECSVEVYKPRYTEQYRTEENTFRHQFSSRRQAAKRNGIPFTIKFEELLQPEFCPILGYKLNYGCSKAKSLAKNGLSGRDFDKATIDKVIPELGYVPDNVRVISWRANKLKSDMTVGELEKILAYIKDNGNGESV